MNRVDKARIHVFGGTSDAVQVCQLLEQKGIEYGLSVATDAGRETALGLRGEVVVGRLDVGQMKAFFVQHDITLIIDATHPYAQAVSINALQATKEVGLPLIRYERKSQIDEQEHPLLIKVPDIEAACWVANKLGQRVFLTTGSKDVAVYKRLLTGKKLIVRVLPTEEVISQCVALGFGIEDIVAIKGPFDQQMNKAMYQFYQADVVITKESGKEGGYQEKVIPCLELGIPCIVVMRPELVYLHCVTMIDELYEMLKAFLIKK